ncbi:AraC family transcriptional regulator [Paenibacillus sp.]|uniref:AraC family transcriptional regulator n=1 Tax=Paenibacillus sp. TaxID=58172 RepID=UPI002D5DDF86|nr:AraC family transcriptional regulator [Paenibacillus sp.]HZG56944.1 AraC family transcriptional regulator [Paenibacillus sp.]
MNVGSLNELQPVVNFASRDAANPGDTWGPRYIPDFQLFYVVSGDTELTVGGERLALKAGDVGLYGPDRPHRLVVRERTEFVSLHFLWNGPSAVPVHPAYAIREAEEAELQRVFPPYAVDCPGFGSVRLGSRLAPAGAESLLMRIVREYRMELPGYPLQLRALLSELLLSLARELLSGDARERAGKIDAALHAMRERPERAWTVTELAALCGYHPSYFTQVFFREQGKKPKQYLIEERIKEAKRALLRGEAIESVAERLGYGSIHYFSSNFKKETGLSPSEFRQRPGRVPQPSMTGPKAPDAPEGTDPTR